MIHDRVERYWVFRKDRRPIEGGCVINVPAENLVDHSSIGCGRVVSNSGKTSPRKEIDRFIVPGVLYDRF